MPSWNDLYERISQMTPEERETDALYVDQDLDSDGYPTDKNLVTDIEIYRANEDILDILPHAEYSHVVIKKGGLFLAG